MSHIRGGKPPGLDIERTDNYVDIPFGAVGLCWLKQYLPLVLHRQQTTYSSGPKAATTPAWR